ncbi:MAG TPA: DUF58 domain-containing protein [Jatrophihabitans sp.]|nr:DUF58 domain-containing protein [Jatrophihabitans sp.]
MTVPVAGRIGFTNRATCLLAAGATAILCGVLFGEVDLTRAGILAAVIPLIAALLVHRAHVRIANRRRVQPTEGQAGQAVTVHLTITNRSLLPTGALMLEDRLPDRVPGRARFVVDPLSGREARPVSYRIPALGRGHYRVGPLRMRLTDPFRLIDLTRSFTATSEFVLTPAIDHLPAIEPPRADDIGDDVGSRSVGSHGADDQSTREYRTGDDLRKIHWRSSARTGTLMVRQEERPWQGQCTMLLDARRSAHVESPEHAGADPRLLSSFEWAVSAIASVGSHLLGRGRTVSLVTDSPTAAERIRFGDAGRLASYLADLRESPQTELAPATTLLRTASRESTLFAVLGRLDPATVRAVADAHAHGRSSPAFAMLLDVDSWAAPLDAAPAQPAEPPAIPATLQAGAGVLRSAGWRVAIVRRGDTTAAAWRLLLAGIESGGRPLIGARR